MNEQKNDKAFKKITSYFLYLYLFFNISCFFYFSLDGYLGGDFKNKNIETNTFLLFISLLIVIFTFLFYLKLIYKISEKITTPHLTFTRNNTLAFITSVILFFGIYAALFFKVGVLGLEEIEKSPKVIRWIYVITQPLYFGLIYLYYISNFKSTYFKVNLILYLTLVLLCGQTIQLLLVFILYIYYRYSYKNNSNHIILITIMGILIYPIFRVIKDTIILSFITDSNFFHNIEKIISLNLLDIYIHYLFITLERFQIISNIQFLISNQDNIYNGYENISNGLFGFFSNYWLQISILKLFMLIDQSYTYTSPQSYLAYLINNKTNWASHIGQAGYFIFYGINGIYIWLYSILLSLFSFILSKIITNKNNITLLTWILILQFICHGWIFAFTYFLQTLILFSILLFILGKLKIDNKNIERNYI
ncbi:oligosaccharide repeat unit polymerase [Proteus sp. G2667]|uniref:oligosaccharide repeat unit polymerase n=1 Tax=Proteus sp. G2667 TaxID=2698880 RepID=UPI0013772592|nr:oligosaccharide repeat unit polymerase [Proteus sp. G2667]NBM57124.1 oligosaccharide repeat unit polymerase [Proteus sp. G2667]